MLEVGTKAPEFSLPDQNGNVHTLEEYRGKKVILYFYPKDNTPGCSKQACGFGELYPQFVEKGAVVLGVSKDSVASHKRVRGKIWPAVYAAVRHGTFLHPGIRCVEGKEDVWKSQHGRGADDLSHQ